MTSDLIIQPSYDAIIIGAGNNGLTCSWFYRRYDNNWRDKSTRIYVDVHAFGYQLENLSPVSGELQLYNYGFELIEPEICYSHIFPDGGSISMYWDLQITVNSLEKYLKKDAQTEISITWEYFLYLRIFPIRYRKKW